MLCKSKEIRSKIVNLQASKFEGFSLHGWILSRMRHSRDPYEWEADVQLERCTQAWQEGNHSV